MDGQTTSPHIVRFGVFELHTRSGELRRHGMKIRLPDQSFQILKVLLSRPGEVVTRDELRHVLWTSDTFVDFEVGLNSAVRKLREALDDSAENPRFVETLPRRGYRFMGSAVTLNGDVTTTPVLAPAESGDPRLAVMIKPASSSTIPPAVGAVSFLPSATADIRPHHGRAGGWRTGGLLLLAVLFATGMVYRRGGPMSVLRGSNSQPIRAVVVLPFENLS